MHLEDTTEGRERVRRARSISSIEETQEKLIEKHFVGALTKNKRSFFHLSGAHAKLKFDAAKSGKERARATGRKKTLTTKANMVGNERVASTFSVP